MSTKPNHRRGHGRIQGNGPRFENPNPEAGCNSTHVARARSAWKTMARRAERRIGANWKKFYGGRYTIPFFDKDEDSE